MTPLKSSAARPVARNFAFRNLKKIEANFYFPNAATPRELFVVMSFCRQGGTCIFKRSRTLTYISALSARRGLCERSWSYLTSFWSLTHLTKEAEVTWRKRRASSSVLVEAVPSLKFVSACSWGTEKVYYPSPVQTQVSCWSGWTAEGTRPPELPPGAFRL